jgi:hypothetical protein
MGYRDGRALCALLVLFGLLVLAPTAQAHRNWTMRQVELQLQDARFGDECRQSIIGNCYEDTINAWNSDFDGDGTFLSGNHSYEYRGRWIEEQAAVCRVVTIRANVEAHSGDG